MRKNLAALAAATALCAIAPAANAASYSAADLYARGLLRPNIVVPTPGDIDDPFFRNGDFTGVGRLRIQTQSSGRGAFSCSGTFINPRVVLTAAHCLDMPDLRRVRFVTGPYGGIDGDGEQYAASHVWIHPDYNPNAFFEGFDIAAVVLRDPARGGEDIYQGFRNPFEELFEVHRKVGYGTTGDGANGTNEDIFDLFQRSGYNNYEFTGNQIFTDVNSNVWLYDTDNGRSENDAFGFIWNLLGAPGASDTGIYYSPSLDQFAFGPAEGGLPSGADDWRLVEVGAAPGDSGGPTFINGRIAGVTSFGVSGGIFDGSCGPGFIDPSFDAFDFCTNSSWGELGGDTRVSAFVREVEALENFRSIGSTNRGGVVFFNAIPSPSALALFGLGAITLGGARRRRG